MSIVASPCTSASVRQRLRCSSCVPVMRLTSVGQLTICWRPPIQTHVRRVCTKDIKARTIRVIGWGWKCAPFFKELKLTRPERSNSRPATCRVAKRRCIMNARVLSGMWASGIMWMAKSTMLDRSAWVAINVGSCRSLTTYSNVVLMRSGGFDLGIAVVLLQALNLLSHKQGDHQCDNEGAAKQIEAELIAMRAFINERVQRWSADAGE